MTISLARQSTKSLATLASRLIEISKKSEHAVVLNHPLLAALILSYAAYDAVYGKSIYSGKGKEVADADNLRDETFAGLKFILIGYAKISMHPRCNDARELNGIIEKYGIDLDRYTYAEESAAMKKLLEDFEKPENAAKFNLLSLTEVLTLLKTQHARFEELFSEQVQANAGLRQMESASSLRSSLESALRNYLGMVKAMKVLDDWKALSAEVDEVLKAAKNYPTADKEETPAEGA